MKSIVQATELFLLDEAQNRILLGRKKTGLGKGKILGIGGHIEAGESTEEATVREMFEETKIEVDILDLIKVAETTFLFPYKPQWDMKVHHYIARRWIGVPTETDEMDPMWFQRGELPFHAMWDDAKHWLPVMLNGQFVVGTFTIGADNENVSEYEMDSSRCWLEM